MADYSSMIGQTYGYWTVVGLSDAPQRVRCQCRCGTVRDVSVPLLKKGGSKSCGCMRLKKDGAPFSSRRKLEKVVPGQRYGMLTALEEMNERVSGRIVWKCQCDCGNITYITATHLKKGDTKSCGCAGAHTNLMDISGQRFGRLVALEPTEKRLGNSVIWKCQCDCGKIAEIAAVNLRKGDTKSCGCLASEVHRESGKEVSKKAFDPYRVDGTYVHSLMRPPTKRNTSGKTGVTWCKSCKRWKASIIFKKRYYYLGSSKDIERAIELREEAEKHIHGPFLEWFYETFPDRKRKGKLKRHQKEPQEDDANEVEN